MKLTYKSHIGIRSITKLLVLCSVLFIPMLFTSCDKGERQTTRKERRLIASGNDLYREGKFADAKVKYKSALEENPSSAVALMNLGLCDYRLAEMTKDNDSIRTRLMQDATASLQKVAELGGQRPALSSKANYNLGNIQFEAEDYGSAIGLYKDALRANPDFEDARFNLRIAQLKQQNQNQNKDQNKEDQNKEDQNKEDQQDQQDQNKDQQDQQDQNQDQQNQDQQNQPPKDNELSQQAAQQILNAVENNEQRARGSNAKGKEARGHGGNLKKW